MEVADRHVPRVSQISLYSSYNPSLRTWALQPPAESFAGVLGLIHRNLPSTPSPESLTSRQLSPLTFIAGMGNLVIVVLLPAIWGWTQNQSWVWTYAFLAFFFINRFCIQLITRFDGRGQTVSSESAGQ